jgi:hypothetical protein
VGEAGEECTQNVEGACQVGGKVRGVTEEGGRGREKEGRGKERDGRSALGCASELFSL